MSKRNKLKYIGYLENKVSGQRLKVVYHDLRQHYQFPKHNVRFANENMGHAFLTKDWNYVAYPEKLTKRAKRIKAFHDRLAIGSPIKVTLMNGQTLVQKRDSKPTEVSLWNQMKQIDLLRVSSTENGEDLDDGW